MKYIAIALALTFPYQGQAEEDQKVKYCCGLDGRCVIVKSYMLCPIGTS